MMRPVNSLRIVGLLVLVGLTGCAQLSVEDEAIQRFTSALQSRDLGDLREMTSDTFQQKALRHTESLDDLKILRLPKDPPTVAKIEDVSETQKNVTVSTEGSGRRLLYRLILTDGNWVVDDIYMKQKQKGLKVTRSVTEQMDLLLSVREFLTDWDQGNRDDVVNITSPEFAAILKELPPNSLARLTSRISEGQSDRTAFRPEAQLDGDRAVVKLPRTTGELLISFVLLNDGWKVDDVGLQDRSADNSSASIRRQAEILLAGANFLDAYQQSNKEALKQLCTSKFHRGSLAPADLTLQPLPAGHDLGRDHEIRSFDQQASIILPHGSDDVKIDFVREENLDDPTIPGTYVVDDVTLFQTDGSQQRRLSSVFTSRARLMIFQDALQRGDLAQLKRLTTNDFDERVWNHVDERLMTQLPLDSVRRSLDGIESSEFLGPMTRLTTRSGDQSIVWVLKETNGQMAVDDILVESETAPASMKERLELIVPAMKFAMALHGGKVNDVARVCSRDFNRLVWKHTQTVPNLGLPVTRLLTSPLTKVSRRSTARGLVQLGDQNWGARLHMIEEQDHWVVDEISLITGLELTQRADLKHAYRHQLAVNSRRSSRSRKATAMAQLSDVPPTGRTQTPSTDFEQTAQAQFESQPQSAASGVVPATFEFESDSGPDVDRVVDPSQAPITIPFE